MHLADRDIVVFNILKKEPDAHFSIVCFHAQQAVEKALKAVLFSRQIEFKRTHSLTELALLLRQDGIDIPVTDDQLRQLTPFAVTFRYDDMDVALIAQEDVTDLVIDVRKWAEDQVNAAVRLED